MYVSLSKQCEKFIESMLASGQYHSASEIIREGLQLLEERNKIRDLRFDSLRKEIDQGLQSGKGKAWNADEFFAKAHKEFYHINRPES
ncbi:type II toxin-antitoxin system ParD family antitoxin [Rapidithrix thailandica]|uniref:Type II toxin-antitoxin system ParD family antitoxin n=1 Tax=Rapidithrix thailandica TaxID=413964 RepID=A0AAW9S3H8_9BACT